MDDEEPEVEIYPLEVQTFDAAGGRTAFVRSWRGFKATYERRPYATEAITGELRIEHRADNVIGGRVVLRDPHGTVGVPGPFMLFDDDVRTFEVPRPAIAGPGDDAPDGDE